MKSKLILIFAIYATATNLFAQECIPNLMQNPSESVVSKYLVAWWKTTGTDTEFPEIVINAFDKLSTANGIFLSAIEPNPIGFKTYHVNVNRLNIYINEMSKEAEATGKKYVVYFPHGTYVVDVGSTPITVKKNVIIRGQGRGTIFALRVQGTPFIDLTNFSTLFSMSNIGENKDEGSGLECLDVTTAGLFGANVGPNLYSHSNPIYDYLINKSIIDIRNSKYCWVKGVNITGGFGATIDIAQSSNIKIYGCRLNYSWVHCGVGGTQGYGINLVNSKFCLVENNEVGDMRHAIILQYGSSKNVVSYNYCHDSWACEWWTNSWDIALHGRSANGDYVCYDKDSAPSYNLIESNYCSKGIRIDNEHSSNGWLNVLYRNFSEDEIAIEHRGTFAPTCDRVNSENYHVANVGSIELTATNTFTVERESSTTISVFNPYLLGTYDIISFSAQELGKSCYLNSEPSWLGNLPKFGFGNCYNSQFIPMQGWWSPYDNCGGGALSSNVPIQVEWLGQINCDIATGGLGTIRLLNVCGGVAPYNVTMSINGQFLSVRTADWPNSSFEADFFGHNRSVVIKITDAVGKVFNTNISTRCSNRFGTGDFISNEEDTNVEVDRVLNSSSDDNLNFVQSGKLLSISSFTKPVAFPNPFNSQTTVRYNCLERQNVSIKLFNATGQQIQEIFSGLKEKGFQEFEVERQNLPTGIYFCYIAINKKNHILKLTID